MRRTCPPRAQALVLCLTLLLGGFGLPLLDAAWFHSTSAARAERAETQLQGQDGTGVPHALSCAVLMSAAGERGLPALGATTIQEAPYVTGPSLIDRHIPVTTPDATLSLPRAPPSA